MYATSAFGVGVDLVDVLGVVILPGSVSTMLQLVQMIGRVGRRFSESIARKNLTAVVTIITDDPPAHQIQNGSTLDQGSIDEQEMDMTLGSYDIDR
ncbi:hypothetical protein SeMB42_g06955 [Synchytrium endobioticum]|uniref:Uncharacterized protein n=1 Tax=Synchytrium endobioticum TaxID=286115 RepID=A0A507CHY0_9FUNG|nr:hypothetical protein SeMB42_g06955 [Synchytrium endobioticum]TPX47976.1 hypothetical protein SeLEV6574_g02331 [Synchytrium endobioticum]